MLWIIGVIFINLHVGSFKVIPENRLESPGNLNSNQLNLNYDHCRYPQTFSRELWTCVCPETFVKDGDDCICNHCLFNTDEDSYAERKGESLPTYMNEFLRDFDEDESSQFGQKSSNGVSSRILTGNGKTGKATNTKGGRFVFMQKGHHSPHSQQKNSKKRKSSNKYDKYVDYILIKAPLKSRHPCHRNINGHSELMLSDTRRSRGSSKGIPSYSKIIVPKKDSYILYILKGMKFKLHPTKAEPNSEESTLAERETKYKGSEILSSVNVSDVGKKLPLKKINWDQAKILKIKRKPPHPSNAQAEAIGEQTTGTPVGEEIKSEEKKKNPPFFSSESSDMSQTEQETVDAISQIISIFTEQKPQMIVESPSKGPKFPAFKPETDTQNPLNALQPEAPKNAESALNDSSKIETDTSQQLKPAETPEPELSPASAPEPDAAAKLPQLTQPLPSETSGVPILNHPAFPIFPLPHQPEAEPDAQSFSDSVIAGQTMGSAQSGQDIASGLISSFRGTGTMSLGSGGGSAGAVAITGQGATFAGLESLGAQAFGEGVIGKKSTKGTSTSSLLVGEGDAIAANALGKRGAASATAVATKKTSSAGSAAYGPASAAASATPGKGGASSSAAFGTDLNAAASVNGKLGPVSETAAVGNANDSIPDLIAPESQEIQQLDSLTNKNLALSPEAYYDDIFDDAIFPADANTAKNHAGHFKMMSGRKKPKYPEDNDSVFDLMGTSLGDENLSEWFQQIDNKAPAMRKKLKSTESDGRQ